MPVTLMRMILQITHHMIIWIGGEWWLRLTWGMTCMIRYFYFIWREAKVIHEFLSAFTCCKDVLDSSWQKWFWGNSWSQRSLPSSKHSSPRLWTVLRCSPYTCFHMQWLCLHHLQENDASCLREFLLHAVKRNSSAETFGVQVSTLSLVYCWQFHCCLQKLKRISISYKSIMTNECFFVDCIY